VQNSNPIFSQYDYIENPVWKRLIKECYDSMKKQRPTKIVMKQMLENLNSEIKTAARFWLETQGKSKEWREGLR